MRLPILAALCLPVLLGSGWAADLQTVSLVEPFGVDHVDTEVVTAPLEVLADRATHRVVDAGGQDVPWQRLSGPDLGLLAVMTDLPAGATRSFHLRPGAAPEVANAVVVDDSAADYIEIRNRYTGVRIQKPYAPLMLTPFSDRYIGDGGTYVTVRHPFQGLRFRDGSWSPAGEPVHIGNPWGDSTADRVDAYRVRFIDRGPLRTTVVARYDMTTDGLRNAYGGTDRLHPAGPAHYQITITIDRESPVITCEVDTDLTAFARIDLHAGIRPDTLRYVSHGSSAERYGVDRDGGRYRPYDDSGNFLGDHAQVAIDYREHVAAYFGSGFAGWGYTGPAGADDTRAAIEGWNPWQSDGGWIWHAFRDGAPAGANALALVDGPASRAVAGGGGVGIHSGPGPVMGLTIYSEMRSGSDDLRYDATSLKTIRHAFGIVMLKQAEVPANQDPSRGVAQRAYNRIGGVASLDKVRAMELEYEDPPQGYGAMYMPKEAVDALRRRYRSDTAFAGALFNNDVSDPGRTIMRIWADDSGTEARDYIGRIRTYIREFVDTQVNGDGRLTDRGGMSYWKASGTMEGHVMVLDQALAYGRLSEDDRRFAKAALALYASVLWDDDFVPFQLDPDGSDTLLFGGNLGTPNMPQQYSGARNILGLYLSSHPAMARHQPLIRECVLGVAGQITPSGAAVSCPHYLQPLLQANLWLLQMGMQRGVDVQSALPAVARFARFYAQLAGSRDARYGGLRSIIAVGDGPDEMPALPGVLATILRHHDPELSAGLMAMWSRPGSAYDHLLKIDQRLSAVEKPQGDASFAGYASVLRHGWGGDRESSVHLIGGQTLFDHRHPDNGGLVAYALGAPLILDWPSMYSPSVGNSLFHAVVQPESTTGDGWDADTIPLNGDFVGSQYGGWDEAEQTGVVALPSMGITAVAATTGTGSPRLAWRRTVRLVRADPDHPAIVIDDVLAGTGSEEPMIATFPLVAAGPATGPAGAITPTQSFWDEHGTHQLPTGGTGLALPAGISTLRFSGQRFGSGSRPGPMIDFEVIAVAAEERRATLSSWGVNQNPGNFTGYYQDANDRPFEQRQHLLRIRGAGGFRTIITPWRKGAPPAARSVAASGAAVVIAQAGTSTVIAPDHVLFRSATAVHLLVHGSATVAAGGLSVAGGPAEVRADAVSVLVTMHGPAGTRSIQVPDGAWLVQAGSAAPAGGRRWSLPYGGGGPQTVHLRLVPGITVPGTPVVLGDGTPAPILVGTGSPGDEIVVNTTTDVLVGTVLVDGTGGWRLAVTGLVAGTYAVQARARNQVAVSDPTPAVTVRVAPGGVANRPPELTAIPDMVILRDSTAGPVAFAVGDAETAAADLTLGRSSSRRSVVSLDGIRFGGSGATRSVSIVPVSGRTGTSAITVTVSDGQATTDRTFLVVVQSGDTTVPATPAAPIVAGNGTDSPVVSGTTAPFAIVTVFRSATIAMISTGADGSGAWSTVLSGWPSGTHAVSVTATNDVGASPRSPEVTVLVAQPISTPPGAGSGGGSGGGGCGSGGGLGLMLCGIGFLVCRTRLRSRRSG